MKHFKRHFEEGYDVPVDTHYIQWLKIHHPECNTPHLANPSRTMECHNTHPDPVNCDNINYSTSSPSSPDSNKESTVQGLSNCCQNSSSLILTKKQASFFFKSTHSISTYLQSKVLVLQTAIKSRQFKV